MKRSIKDYIRKILKNLHIVALLMVLTTVITAYSVSSINDKYDAKSVILVEYTGEYSYERLKTYVNYITTRDMLDLVKRNLRMDDVYDLDKFVSAKLIKDTNLIEINVKYEDPVKVIDISNEVYNVFKSNIVSIYPDLQIYIVEQPSVHNITTLDLDSILLIVLPISFVLGCILALIFGSDNVNIKNHEDLKKYLNLKSLGNVPSVIMNDKKKSLGLNIIDNSSSIISESYRMIRTNLDFLDLKVINFTSTSVGEGKSETISNIALAFSMIGKKVLLIDSDLRKPKIHKNFHLNRALGLTDILIYNRIDEYKNVIQEFKVPNKDYKIDVLTAGSKVSDPSEILSSNRFKELIEKLKEDYDLILIDCPPVSLMTDATIVSKVCSGTAYVIEYDRFNYSTVNKCIEQLRDIDVNILGAIINKMDINKQKKIYGDSYEQYYSNYIS